MVEPLQVVVHMPIFACKSPGNVVAFNGYFSEIANFELLDPNDLTDWIAYDPETDPASLNF